MKKVVIWMSIALAVSLANAQKITENEVPSAVKSALQKKYPKTVALKWEKEKVNYEAEFEIAGTEYSVLIDASGNILETEVEISIDELPAKAKAYIAQHYAGQKIKEATKTTDSKGAVTYEAEIKDEDLIFDSNGNFIRAVND